MGRLIPELPDQKVLGKCHIPLVLIGAFNDSWRTSSMLCHGGQRQLLDTVSGRIFLGNGDLCTSTLRRGDRWRHVTGL